MVVAANPTHRVEDFRARGVSQIHASPVGPGGERAAPRNVGKRLEDHPNEVWIEALKGRGQDGARLLEEVSHFVQRILRSTLGRHGLGEEELAELAQEAMTQLVASADTFRGDSAFSTWAAAVATRAANTQRKRRAAREEGHRAYQLARRDALARGVRDEDPDAGDTNRQLVAILHDVIDSELTERQRIATLALLRGVPTVAIAEQLGSNSNAVYKLVHDARLRLRAGLERRGVTAERFDEITTGVGDGH